MQPLPDNRTDRNATPPTVQAAPDGPQPSASEKPRLYPLSGMFGDLYADVARRHDARVNGTKLGALSGFTALDERLGGCFEVGLHVVHGSPGSGKTAFCLQVAALCGCPALFITCEVLPVELMRRHTARVNGTFLGKFKDGSLTPATVVEQAQKAAAEAPYLAILDATNAPASPPDILESVKTVRRLADDIRRKSNPPSAPASPHFLIVLDSLQTWADALGGGEEYDRLNFGVAALRQIAVQERAAILYTSERNRASRSSGGQSSGAGTRKIEYSGETVIGLQAQRVDGEGNPDYDAFGETPVHLVIGKNRHGEAGKELPFQFSGRCQRFRPADGEASIPTATVDMGTNLKFPKRTNGTGK